MIRRLILIQICSLLCLGRAFPESGHTAADSLSLFPLLKTTDGQRKLAVLEKIYAGFYEYYPEQAHAYALQALRLARKLKVRDAEAGACYYLSFYYSCLGSNDSALYFCRAGMEISRAINSVSRTARGYARLGSIYRQTGDKAKAIWCLRKAIAMDSLNQETVATCCQSLGIAYSDAGCHKEAVYYYLKALKIREEQKAYHAAGYICCNLSGVYFDITQEKEKGLQICEKAIGFFRKAGYLKGEGYACNTMGLHCMKDKDYDAALKYFRKSLAINSLDTLLIRSGYSFNLTNIGDTWLNLERYDSAEIYYKRALKFSARDRDNIPLACVYLSLGDLNTRQKKYARAIEFLNKGLQYSRLANYRAQWEEAFNLLSLCYAASGDNEKALFFLRKRNEVRDSIVSEKAHLAVANMMIRYETEKKDAQIKQLSTDSNRTRAKIRIAVMIILLILLTTAVLVYITWVYYRKKLMPQVRSLNFIQEKITLEKEGDSRRLRALGKVLPPELKPFSDSQPQEIIINPELTERLEHLLEKKKIYLNESLTLAETAIMLDTNTTYLSRLINEYYKVNFSAFLNRYRVEEAKRMILDDRFNNFSMEGIAKSSGFRSKSTFNQVFKQATGLTPTQFASRNSTARIQKKPCAP